MQDDFLASIIRHREARTGKPFRHTKRQQESLDEFDEGTEKAARDLERVTATMDDKNLLISTLSGEYMQLECEEDV